MPLVTFFIVFLTDKSTLSIHPHTHFSFCMSLTLCVCNSVSVCLCVSVCLSSTFLYFTLFLSHSLSLSVPLSFSPSNRAFPSKAHPQCQDTTQQHGTDIRGPEIRQVSKTPLISQKSPSLMGRCLVDRAALLSQPRALPLCLGLMLIHRVKREDKHWHFSL